MIVLSLFDGMSCGRIALERAGIFVTRYFASEVDRYANKVVAAKWPDTIQIGDVSKASYHRGVLTTEHGSYPVKIDLVIGGSPCQGFSFAGKRLNFEDPRSKLFFEFARIVSEIKAYNPDVKFLLENVQMTIENQRVINSFMGVEPLEINSALVSAHNRVRLYWTDFKTEVYGILQDDVRSTIPQPKDAKIYLKSVLQPVEKIHRKYYCTKKALTSAFGEDYMATFSPSHQSDVYGILSDRGIMREKSDKSNCVLKSYHKGMDNHGQRTMILYNDTKKIRKLTPIECCRLQGVPDDYFFVKKEPIVSETQMYCMLGNGWQVDTIVYLLKHL